MADRPILFSGPMVRAILDGRKTQTRRILKNTTEHKGPYNDAYVEQHISSEGWGSICPYGKPGDRLWVRETFADVNSSDGPALLYRADGDLITWDEWCVDRGSDYGAGSSMNYDKYPGEYSMWWEDLLNGEPGHRWKPPIFMPRWASRITLWVVGVRVGRLNDITENDAIAEGAAGREAFKQIWESIYGEGAWDSNPWVWVIEFKKLEQQAQAA